MIRKERSDYDHLKLKKWRWGRQSKHLRGQLDRPVRDVTFLHQGGQLETLKTPQNCILARRSSLGLASRGLALA